MVKHQPVVIGHPCGAAAAAAVTQERTGERNRSLLGCSLPPPRVSPARPGPARYTGSAARTLEAGSSMVNRWWEEAFDDGGGQKKTQKLPSMSHSQAPKSDLLALV